MTAKQKSLTEALVSAQQAMTKLQKNAENPHFRSKYADLGAVQDACFPALHSEGIGVLQAVTADGSGVETRFIRGDDSVSCVVPFVGQAQNMQQYGSQLTYARRYGLMMLAGLAPVDDDGNAANEVKQKEPASKSNGKQAGSDKPTFKKIMGDIKNCNDMDRLMQIKAYVEANADTSKAKLLEMIADREHDLAVRDQ